MIAHGVSKRDPAAAIVIAAISDLGRAEQENALYLTISAPVRRSEVEVDSPRRLLELVDFNEQETVVSARVEDHALLVAGPVRIALNIDVAEHSFPPLGKLERVDAIDAGM